MNQLDFYLEKFIYEYLPFTFENNLICKLSRQVMIHLYNNKSMIIYNFFNKYKLADNNHSIWTGENNNSATKKTWIRHYLARYPEDCLEDLINLFPSKLGRSDLVDININKLYTRRHLKKILEKCTTRDIFFVGW